MQNRMKEIVNHVDKVSPGLWTRPPSPSVGTEEVAERLAWVGRWSWSQSQAHRGLQEGDHSLGDHCTAQHGKRLSSVQLCP